MLSCAKYNQFENAIEKRVPLPELNKTDFDDSTKIVETKIDSETEKSRFKFPFRFRSKLNKS